MINTDVQASKIKLESFSSLLAKMLPKARVSLAEARTSVLQLESLILRTHQPEKKLLILQRAEKSPYC